MNRETWVSGKEKRDKRREEEERDAGDLEWMACFEWGAVQYCFLCRAYAAGSIRLVWALRVKI